MRDCKEYAEIVPDYVDEQVNSELLQKIKLHTSQCSECQRISEDLKYIRSCLCRADTVTTETEFNQNLLRRIYNHPGAKAGVYARYHTQFNMVATFLLVFGAVWSYRLWNYQAAPQVEMLTPTKVSIVKDHSNKMVAYSNDPGLLSGQSSVHVIGWIGVGVSLQNSNQVVVSEIVTGTPAEKVGIRAGDILVSINGIAITHPQQLEQFIRNIHDNSDLLDMILQRDNSVIEKQVVMESRLVPDK